MFTRSWSTDGIQVMNIDYDHNKLCIGLRDKGTSQGELGFNTVKKQVGFYMMVLSGVFGWKLEEGKKLRGALG